MIKNKKRILVLGGGFAGLECTRKLESYFRNDINVEIVLISEDNFLLFTPMLPQVASGMIETRHIIMPIRTLCEKAIFYEGKIRNIDPFGKIVNLWGTAEKRGLSLHYDFLVLALGSQTNFFGLTNVEQNAFTMKTLNDAVMLRNRVIDMLEQAENETDPIRKKSLLTFVIAGAGFAGIETSGELHDFILDATKYYPNIQRKDLRVIVVEALAGILPSFTEKLARFAKEKMEKRGIEIRLNTTITNFDGKEIIVKELKDSNKKSGNKSEMKSVLTRTLIWTAGITPVNTVKRSVFKTERGKIIVNEFLQISEYSEVFAIGDVCQMIDPQTEKPYPPTAQIAEAQGKIVAYNLQALIKNKKKKKFEYKPKGQMAIIGKRSGIASIFGISVSGFWAWWLWRNVYLSKIPKFDKRFRVWMDWFIDQFFDRDISRLKILRREKEIEYKELDEVDDVW